MAATRFSDSATPNFDLTKSRPKYSTTYGLTTTTFYMRFVELQSISRHFGQFRALLKVLPVSELYFWATDLNLVHPVFLLKAFLAVYVRYGDNAGQNKAKKSVPGALEAKPEVEIWRRPVFLTQRPQLCPKLGQSTQLLPVLQIHFRFDHDGFLHAFLNYNQFHDISDHFGHF